MTGCAVVFNKSAVCSDLGLGIVNWFLNYLIIFYDT